MIMGLCHCVLCMHLGIETLGKNAVVCGRSKNVGLPIALLLHADGAGETEACQWRSSFCSLLFNFFFMLFAMFFSALVLLLGDKMYTNVYKVLFQQFSEFYLPYIEYSGEIFKF